MKINEVTNSARKIIKQIESLYVTYISYGSIIEEQKLWNLVTELEKSNDIDVKNSAVRYKAKLVENLIVILINQK